jgi:hypothetical protein
VCDHAQLVVYYHVLDRCHDPRGTAHHAAD